MYDELTPAAQEEYSLPNFRDIYDEAAAAATNGVAQRGRGHRGRTTAASVPGEHAHPRVRRARRRAHRAAHRRQGGVGAATSSTRASTRASGSAARPGRPPRAAILAADRSPLAEGPASARIVGTAALAVVGEVGSPKPAQAEAARDARFPARDADRDLGARARVQRPARRQARRAAARRARRRRKPTPGGRVLATSQPERGKAVRTEHRPRPAGERRSRPSASLYGGAAVLDAKTGAVLALAGLAYSAPQPPGIDLQDHHGDRGARRRDRQALRRVPGRDPRTPTSAARSRTPTTSCAAARSSSQLRRLVQHGLRPARGRARRREARRDRRALRLQLPAGPVRPATTALIDPRRARSQGPLRERRDRRVGDRPGRGAGDAAGDGRGRRRRSPTTASACRTPIARDPGSQPPATAGQGHLAGDRGDAARS